MTQVFDKDGKLTPVTVIKIVDNVVIANRTVEKNGYSAAVIGTGDKKKSQVTKPYAGQFEGVCEPKQTVMEMRDFDQEVNVGDVLGVDMFKDITFVDVTGTSKGKGFQGGMKRHHFGGGRATHGSKFHRDLGGTSMGSDPSRNWKGTKMAGQMGNERSTIQNLRVVSVDSEMQVILVKGAIPGATQSTVIVRKAVKK